MTAGGVAMPYKFNRVGSDHFKISLLAQSLVPEEQCWWKSSSSWPAKCLGAMKSLEPCKVEP